MGEGKKWEKGEWDKGGMEEGRDERREKMEEWRG